jgi:ABC-2 type transport system permease protein
MSARMPSLRAHLGLLWGLRLQLARNVAPGHPLRARLALLSACLPALVGGGLTFALVRLLLRLEDLPNGLWIRFVLALVGFVTFCVQVIWPLLSAGVDDHSELSRYAAFPLPTWRLLLASTLGAMAEPRALFFTAPLVGSALGLWPVLPAGTAGWVVPLLLAELLLCATWSRVGLHVMLNLLSARRSAQLLGGGMVLFLLGASLLPSVDVRWLEAMGTAGLGALDHAFLQNAAHALSRVPSGWIAAGLMGLATGRPGNAVLAVVGMLIVAGIGLWVAHALLLRFHRASVRGGARSAQPRAANPFARSGGLFATLVVREALELWNHPRARLLACVPFVLAILLKLLSGRGLLLHFLGPAADAWIAGGLAMYGALVMTSTFAQNAFGYDGHGLAALWAAPIPPPLVLRAKNLVHASAGLLLALLALGFFRVYFGAGTPWTLLTALLGTVVLVAVLVAAGNQLSITFPVKFHADLRRRDRLPLSASMLGILAACVGGAPFGFAVRQAGPEGPGAVEAVAMAGAAVLAVVIALGLQPVAERRLLQRREHVLRAVTRE